MARQCHITKQKLPCPMKDPGQCPLENISMLNDLAWYLYGASRGMHCLMGKFQRILSPIPRVRPDVEAIDISALFPDHGWTERLHMYFCVGVCRVDRDFCNQLQVAHRRWLNRLSPPGYRWRGK